MSGLTRRSDRWRIVVAALMVATGELAAAWLAGGETPWRLWTAPVVLAGLLIVAGLFLRPLGGSSIVRTAFLLAVSVLAASALVALGSPGDLRESLPVIGGSTGGFLVILAGSRAEGGRRFC